MDQLKDQDIYNRPPGMVMKQPVTQFSNPLTPDKAYTDEADFDRVWNNIGSPEDYRMHKRWMQVEWSPRFCWWLLPTIEINTSMREVALYFLCISVYFCWGK